MKAIGLDPDLHDLAIGVWDDSGPVAAHVVHLVHDKALSGRERVERMIRQCLYDLRDFRNLHEDATVLAVEGQSLKREGMAQHRRPGDIVKLAQVAGAAYGVLMTCWPMWHDARLPEPEEWKGSVPKHAMQARLYKELGWGYSIIGKDKDSYARPSNIPEAFKHILPGAWRHVGDALLLARWIHRERS